MTTKRQSKGFIITLIILAATLGVVFAQSFAHGKTLFSNDGPLGLLMAEYGSMKTALVGVWNDQSWLGVESPTALPNTAAAFWFLLGNSPIVFSKFHVPIALLGLGLSLWCLFRAFGFRTSVCTLGAIAAAFNMNIFSHACWGLPSRAWTLASTFLALAALVSGTRGRPWLKALLAGLAVSNGIMEGFDVGAIFSLYVGAFAIFVPFATQGEAKPAVLAQGVLRAGVVAGFSALCAAAALYTLIGTQVAGVADMGQDAATREARWDAATMWSLPKSETLRVLVPGLFGYRMDTPEGGNYWGAVGQQPGVPQSRHSGSGEYAGALVLLLAAFAVANAFRRKNNPFTPFERRVVLFFAAAAVISLLFAWGRHAPFYRIIYALPYFSTIRNPIKFMHPFHMAVLILFGFGLETIFRVYAGRAQTQAAGLIAAFKGFWKTAGEFERRWAWGSLAFAGLLVLGALVYVSSSREMLTFLQHAGFQQPMAEEMLKFSHTEVVLAIGFLLASVLVLILALSGWFTAPRVRALVLVFGVLLTVDLVRANRPWVQYYDYLKTYGPNPVVDFLRQNPYEHRVTARLAPFFSRYLIDPNRTEFFGGVANNWLQTIFPYNNIQSLEPIQMPRTPQIDQNYFTAFAPIEGRPPAVFIRLWELTNTRYLLGDRQFLQAMMAALDPGKQRLRPVLTFDVTLRPGVTPQTATSDDYLWVQSEAGRFAIMEFTGALPRTQLYPVWRTVEDDPQALTELASPAFDPASTVLLQDKTTLTPAGTGATNFQGGVNITAYESKRIELTATNSAPAILLYNDKFSPHWKLTVDGQPATLLRANYIMRGIALPAGAHQIKMVYRPPITGLYLSAAAMAAGLAVLICVLLLPERPTPPGAVGFGRRLSIN